MVDLAHDIHASDRPRDGLLAELAARQHGVVSHGQLRQLGYGRGAISHRTRTGQLHRLYRGIYAVGHPAISRWGRLMAAVMACGQAAVLSHRDAGALWGLRESARQAIDVTVPGRRRASRPGIDVHSVRRLHRDDRTRRGGIPVTTVARTLLDLAEVLHPQQLRRAFEQAELLELFDLRAVQRLIERSRGRRGLKPLMALVAEARPVTVTRSELERRFLDVCRHAGLPPPATNALVAGFEVDAVWFDWRLVVELDGHAYHRTRAAFERDPVRDAALQVAGFRVLRVTYRRLDRQPGEVVRTILALR